MINPKANPLLVKIEQERRAKVPANQQANVDKIVAAGVAILDDEKTHQLVMNQLKAKGDPADIAGAGAAKLLGVLMNRSKGTMPMQAGIPAATILLLEVLDRMEALGKIQINNDSVAQATHALASSLMQLLGIDQRKLAAMIQPKPQGQPQPAQPAQPAQSAQPQQPLIGAPA